MPHPDDPLYMAVCESYSAYKAIVPKQSGVQMSEEDWFEVEGPELIKNIRDTGRDPYGFWGDL